MIAFVLTCDWMSQQAKRLIVICPVSVIHLLHDLQEGQDAHICLCRIRHLQLQSFQC